MKKRKRKRSTEWGCHIILFEEEGKEENEAIKVSEGDIESQSMTQTENQGV